MEDYTDEVVKPDSELPTMLARHHHHHQQQQQCANGKGLGLEEESKRDSSSFFQFSIAALVGHCAAAAGVLERRKASTYD